MTGSETVLDVLEKASHGSGAILSRRECRGFDTATLAELKDNLRDLGRHSDGCQGDASAELFGRDGSDLGHAPAWIDAGLVYEGFASAIATHGSPETVFCLDPWAAQLRSRAQEIAPRAKWILISDLEARKSGKDRDYWEQLERYFQTLSFSVIIPKKAWDEALTPSEMSAPLPRGSELFAQKPGAWTWRRLSRGTEAASVVLLVRYSGSLAHLRVLLDSVIRQEGLREDVRVGLLAGAEGEDPRTYLKWFEMAHPTQPVSLIRTAGDWRAELNLLLGKAPGAAVVMLGDHGVLPPGFLGTVRQGARPVISGIPVGLEASAHILTGNLDPVQSYETLLRTFASAETPRTLAGRIVPAESWNDGKGDSASLLLEIAGRPETNSDSPLLILELGNLP